ncbi:MAG: TonB family protein [Pyrinomonadaceae bacterium]
MRTFLGFSLLIMAFAGSHVTSQAAGPQEKDRKLKILKKPQPSMQGCGQSAGGIRARVTFDKSGKVGVVDAERSSGCDSFDRSAVRAAKEIRFEPAMKNGELITVVKLIEYTFNRY